ncbi:MAG: PEP-CTERM sorting domain-containing protein, partial [Myxococcales bacterium]|nr:PEP-CTERM sorting domain-containing protein [Myxococcales bacterium]
SVVKTGMGQQAGTWIINRGPNTFGGAMGLLGKYGSVGKYVVPGVAGTYSGYGTWNVIVAMGRCFECTPVSFTAMGKASNWLNPFEKTQQYTNDLNGKTSAWLARGTGTLWTTGSVTLYATAGIYTTILHRAGFDTVTGSGARNIQLVTPTLTHWIGIGFQSHTGQMGILNLRVPEPGALLLLAAGAGVLGLLYRMSRRR